MIFVCSKPLFKLETQTVNCEIRFDENVNALFDVRVCWGLDMDVYVDDDGKEHITLSARYKPVVESPHLNTAFSFSARKGSVVIVQAMLLNKLYYFGKAYFIATNTNSTKHFITLMNEKFEKVNIACTTTNLRRIDVNAFNKDAILNELNANYNIHYIKYDTALLYHLWIKEKITYE